MKSQKKKFGCPHCGEQIVCSKCGKGIAEEDCVKNREKKLERELEYLSDCNYRLEKEQNLYLFFIIILMLIIFFSFQS